MNIYLAGPMRGRELYNLRDFVRGALELRADGHYVFNPIEHDLAYDDMLPHVDLEDQDFNLAEAMRRDLAFITSRMCDAVVFLPEWTDSEGAKTEALAAYQSGKKLYSLRFVQGGRPLLKEFKVKADTVAVAFTIEYPEAESS